MRVLALSLLLAISSVAILNVASLDPCKSLTEEDKQRFLYLFESALSTAPNVDNWRHSVLGYQLFHPNKFPMAGKACQMFGRGIVNSADKPLNNVQTIFSALDGAAALAPIIDCATFPDRIWPTEEALTEISNQLTTAIKSGAAASSAESLYYVVAALKALKAQIDTPTVHELVQKLLKKDSTAASQSYIFHIVVLLNLEKSKLKPHFDDIDDVIQQADETDGTYLYYDSGLFTTAFMVDAIYKLAEKYGEIPKISEDKMLKLSNYLLSRRYVNEPRGAVYLGLALHTLAKNRRIVPVCVAAHGLAQVTASSKSKPLLFTATDVLGQPIDLSLKAVSITETKSKRVIEKGPLDFTKDSTKKGVYALSLADRPLTRGHYTVTFGGPTPTETKTVQYVGITGTSLAFKVVAEDVNVGPLKLIVSEVQSSSATDAARTTSPTLQKVGDSLSTPIHLDTHVKLRISIPVSDASERVPEKGSFRPHQCFLRLFHDETGREIILVATPSSTSSDLLQIIVDPSAQVKDFGYLSGTYTLELLVGDALMQQGVRWNLGKAVIVFPPAPVPPPSAPSADVHRADAPRLPDQVTKPEIHHMFRPADKRASTPISTLFTVLCILPLGLLLTLWGKLGVNVRGLVEGSPMAVGFHACLAGFFVLYYFYWTRWNMFSTLGCVVLLGLPTFLCGNMMLRSIAAKRLQEKKSSDNQ